MLGKPNNTNTNKTVFYLQQKSKDASNKPCAPYFKITTKVGDKYEEKPSQTRVSGNLTKLDLSTKEFEGKKIKTVTLLMQDADEVYYVKFGFSQTGRQLFNTLFSLENFENVEISLFERKKEDKGVTKSYPGVAVWQNGEKVKWKYELADLPKVKEITANDMKINDYSELNAFFEKEISSLSKKIQAAKVSSRPASVGRDIATTPPSEPEISMQDAEEVF